MPCKQVMIKLERRTTLEYPHPNLFKDNGLIKGFKWREVRKI